jgi:hypothetical protein
MRVMPVLLALGLCSFAACNKKKAETEEPDSSRDQLLGPDMTSTPVEGLLNEEEEGEDSEEVAEVDSEITEAEKLAVADKGVKCKAPPKAKPVQKCTGKGKKRVCKEVDPKPEASASFGVCQLMAHFKWGQTPDEVFKFVTEDIEKEYEERQSKAKDPIAQDNNHKWRRDRFKEAKQNHVKFAKAASHRWGVSLIQYDYEDDANEEMIWVKNDNGLRKFYFFKDGALWKVVYAYSTDNFPGKTYDQVVDEKFKKWFGTSPASKAKQDPKTKTPLVSYYEWKSSNGDVIRSFDQTSVHGVIVLAVIDGEAEKRMGERLPNVGSDDKVTDVVNDVLGGSDVCYDKSGSISECPTK